MSSNTDDDEPAEYKYKMCKKIAQLTKVVYSLNTELHDKDDLVNKLREQLDVVKTGFHGTGSDVHVAVQVADLQVQLDNEKDKTRRLEKECVDYKSQVETNQ